MKKMTIKEQKEYLKNKYSDYIKYVSVFRNRDFYTSGPNTGKGSKGTHYIYTYDTIFKRKDETIGELLFANSFEELEKMIVERISEVK